MTDQPRAYYPWELELFAMNEERKAKGIVEQPRLLSAIPPVKLSHVIKFLQEAYAQPEIREGFVALNDKLAAGIIKQDDIDNGWCEESAMVSALLGRFLDWHLIKHDSDDSHLGYLCKFLVLKELFRRGGEADAETILSVMDSKFDGYFFIDCNN